MLNLVRGMRLYPLPIEFDEPVWNNCPSITTTLLTACDTRRSATICQSSRLTECWNGTASSGCGRGVLADGTGVPGNEWADSQECHPFHRRLGHQQTVEWVFVDGRQAMDGDDMITHDR